MSVYKAYDFFWKMSGKGRNEAHQICTEILFLFSVFLYCPLFEAYNSDQKAEPVVVEFARKIFDKTVLFRKLGPRKGSVGLVEAFRARSITNGTLQWHKRRFF